MKALHKKQHTAKGWTKRAPKTRTQRRSLLTTCGAKAFLEPDAKPAPKFPIMTSNCVVDCAALRAAMGRAKQYGYQAVAARAYRKAKKAACVWA